MCYNFYVFLYVLLNDDISIAKYTESNSRSKKLEGMAKFKILFFFYLSGGTGENHDKLQSTEAASGERLQPVTSLI